MGFFSKLWRHTPTAERQATRRSAAEHAVLVFVKLSDEGFGTQEERARCFELEEKLMSAVERGTAGAYDGNEFGGGFFTAFVYGPDADRLFVAMEETLRGWPLPAGSYAMKRYGEPGAREVRVELGGSD